MGNAHTSLGKRIGVNGSFSIGGMFSIREQHALISNSEWQLQTPIVTSGLQLRLDAADPASYSGTGTTWFDLSGNGFNATLVNSPTWTSAQSGYFNVSASSSQTFSVSKPFPNITGQITTEAWVYFNSLPTTGADGTAPTVMHKGSHYTTQLTNGAQNYYFADSSTYSYSNYGNRSIAGQISTGAWRQIVTTKDSGNTVRLYINGSLADTRTAFGNPLTAVDSTLWLIGYSDTDSAPNTSALITGRFAAANVYNRQLSDAEVLTNFNALRGRYGL